MGNCVSSSSHTSTKFKPKKRKLQRRSDLKRILKERDKILEKQKDKTLDQKTSGKQKSRQTSTSSSGQTSTTLVVDPITSSSSTTSQTSTTHRLSTSSSLFSWKSISQQQIEPSKLQHYALKYLWHSNFVAPVREVLMIPGTMVLDLGCGNGSWLNDMANDFPLANYIGLDSEEDIAWERRQPNVDFFETDLFNGIPYPDNSFDYVHARFLGTIFTQRQYRKKVINEIIRVLKPGGIMELVESDFYWNNEGPATAQLLEGYRSLLIENQINPNLSPSLGNFLRKTERVTNIQTESRPLPLGLWGGGLGNIACEAVKKGLADAKISLARRMEISGLEYNQLCAEAFQEFDQLKVSMPTCRWFCTKMLPKPRSHLKLTRRRLTLENN